MNVYMVRDKKTGAWYKCGRNGGSWWAIQEKASIWTTLAGPRGALANVTRYNNRARLKHAAEPEIVTLAVGGSQKVAFVYGDDWEGVYIDGKLVTEGHYVRIDELLQLLGIDGQQICADDTWLAARGSLPENLDEVQRE